MALARDVPFIDYLPGDPLIAQAAPSPNNEFRQFAAAPPVPEPFTLPVTAQTIFRGVYLGEQVGPYVSQFLWKGNSDPRKMNNGGRNAEEGYVAYGA